MHHMKGLGDIWGAVRIDNLSDVVIHVWEDAICDATITIECLFFAVDVETLCRGHELGNGDRSGGWAVGRPDGSERVRNECDRAAA